MSINETNQIFSKKPYFSLNDYLKETYGEKIYKIPLDPGFTCPNRDGTLGSNGCIFCSEGGSGDFSSKTIEEGILKLKGKNINKYIAYFQAFTNTYAPISTLEKIYVNALEHPSVIGISIATRPDCLDSSVLELLTNLKSLYPGKFIWIELGLQTIHESSANYIRRGYPLTCFEDAVTELDKRSIPVIVHLIFGLPGEDKKRMLESISYLNTIPIFGVKLQLLHILKNTDLYLDYIANPFPILTLEEYVSILIEGLEILNDSIVIHRLTGDGPKELLIEPQWSRNKKQVFNMLHKEMKQQNSYQGKRY